MYHNHVRIDCHQSNNWIGSYYDDIYFPKSNIRNNILFQIYGNFEKLTQGEGMFILQ